MRRTWLRGRQNVQKRYLIQVAAYNLGLVMRAVLGAGTPKELAARGAALLWLLDPDVGLLMILVLPREARPEPTSSTGC
jgi:transposase